ncbi:hypothetical protein [Pleurocapsa sp. PCC 7319]|uniref:hypothetical protein n=1 Tax=Pleurocapsa sp. PCC 7319 TaxID=118161 RepID=UPI0003470B34|nr:hypothetical protein [Pleurocapsa sp. PCC 7319]
MQKIIGHLKLVGSEESSRLGIPTTEEIREHLIVKLQTIEGNIDTPTDTWELIHLMAKTPAAVVNLMRYYYEPTDEDYLLKRKLPSNFHLQLAETVASRSGQIIITTNRDRLIEWGLAQRGIAPQVITMQQDLAEWIPFQHTKCTLIKLNGDYLTPDSPKLDRKFQIFLQMEIKQVYQPVFLKCREADRKRFAEFGLKSS